MRLSARRGQMAGWLPRYRGLPIAARRQPGAIQSQARAGTAWTRPESSDRIRCMPLDLPTPNSQPQRPRAGRWHIKRVSGRRRWRTLRCVGRLRTRLSVMRSSSRSSRRRGKGLVRGAIARRPFGPCAPCAFVGQFAALWIASLSSPPFPRPATASSIPGRAPLGLKAKQCYPEEIAVR
jgi:hypothetical protein